MKKLRLKIANNVNVTKMFSASIRGGQRGDEDACTIETHSNDVFPTIRTVAGFIVIGEPYEDSNGNRM